MSDRMYNTGYEMTFNTNDVVKIVIGNKNGFLIDQIYGGWVSEFQDDDYTTMELYHGVYDLKEENYRYGTMIMQDVIGMPKKTRPGEYIKLNLSNETDVLAYCTNYKKDNKHFYKFIYHTGNRDFYVKEWEYRYKVLKDCVGEKSAKNILKMHHDYLYGLWVIRYFRLQIDKGVYHDMSVSGIADINKRIKCIEEALVKINPYCFCYYNDEALQVEGMEEYPHVVRLLGTIREFLGIDWNRFFETNVQFPKWAKFMND